jgi:thioredoxin reductase (NADPH)
VNDIRAELAFPVLDEQQIERLRKIGTPRIAEDGETLIAEGDRGFDFYVVVSGSVEILEHSGGSPTTVTVHEAGEFTGDVDMVTGRSALVTAVARGRTELIQIPAAEIRRFVAEDPELGDIVLQGFMMRRTLLLDSGFSGLRVVGSRYSPATIQLAQFLARNGVPHTWIDVEEDVGAAELLHQLGVSPADTPLVMMGDGTVLKRPTPDEVSDRMGLAAPVGEAEVADLLIVGAGPGGLAAAVYGASEGLQTRVLEGSHPGGQAGGSTRIENYLGFPMGLSGAELTDRALLQAQRFGAKISVPREAVDLRIEPGRKVVRLANGEEVSGRALIIATGADYRRPDIPGLSEFEGGGVYYAASETEARICAGDSVVIVGGGNSAGQAAVFLASRLRRVVIVIRGHDLASSMSQYLLTRIEQTPNIEVVTRHVVVGLEGEESLEAVRLRDRDSGSERAEPARGLFIFIGAVPRTEWLGDQVEVDEKGFLLTGSNLLAGRSEPPPAFSALGRLPHPLETSVPGVFAVGDIRARSVKRVASAVGEGSMAVRFVHEYLARG